MSKIVHKLNLNKTPQLVENNSLILAKNVRLLDDGTIGPDTSLDNIETSTGDYITYTLNHPQIQETVKVYQYTILNLSSAVAYVKSGTNPADLDSAAFDFQNYLPDGYAYADSDNRSAVKKYVRVRETTPCTLFSKQITNTGFAWICRRLRYDKNNNMLKDSANCVFMLAVRNEVYNGGSIPVGQVAYHYIVAPSYLLNTVVTVEGYDFKIINPVYRTNITETVVIQEAYSETVTEYNSAKYISQIVGFDNKIYFFKESGYILYSTTAKAKILAKYTTEKFVGDSGNKTATFDVNSDGYVTRNGILFEDMGIAIELNPDENDRVKIFEYDEVANTFNMIHCGWRYSGGKIDGCCYKNNTGKTILTICEYDTPTKKFVPLKHINLSSCSEIDDESIYTQTPNIPITNLNLKGEYSSVIPSGVYQFFIRYKLNDDRYTNWFPCSKECFAGTKKSVATIQGELKYIDKHIDSDSSFIFDVDHLYEEYNDNYKKFQIGFILSKDDGSIIAREWKEFDFDITTIYFDCLPSDLKEGNIDDFLENSYELFNIGNCVNYKNKLYISNYDETDFNPDLQAISSGIDIDIKAHNIGVSLGANYFDNQLMISSSGNDRIDYIGSEIESNHIRNKWAKSPYFSNFYIQASSDDRGTITPVPYVSDNHWHVENSNVVHGDSSPCNPNSLDDDVLTEINGQQCPSTSWMNTTHIFDYNNAYVLAIYIKDGTTWRNLFSDYRDMRNYGYQVDPRNPGTFIFKTKNSINGIINKADSFVRDRIVYYNKATNKWYVKDAGNANRIIYEYYIVYSVVKETDRKHLKFKNPFQDQELIDYIPPTYYHNSNNGDPIVYNPEFDLVYTTKTTYILKRTTVFDASVITTSISNSKRYGTLLPFTKYNFYIHYVKPNGITTNGYLINKTDVYINKYCKGSTSYTEEENIRYYLDGDIITRKEDDDVLYYPSFRHIVCPDGYVGCFISAEKSGNNVCELFNTEYDDVDVPNSGNLGSETQTICRYNADCLELDTLIYTKFDKLSVFNSYGQEVTAANNKAKYYDSGATENLKFFGQCGSVVWDVNSPIQTDETNDDDIFWIIIPTNESIKKLIKFTPYINLSRSSSVNYDSFEDITSLGFVCFAKKLNKDNLYITGNDIYKVTTGVGSSSRLFLLDDLESSEDMNLLQFILNNPEVRIKSNFNLDYLTLSEDITPFPKTLTYTDELGDEVSTTRLIAAVNSLTSSHIYEFPQCYKTYTRKHYSVYEDKKLTRFDNTIRCSRTIADEEYNTFKFDPTDYYNVPTLRGKITNLISIVNSIYVHCEHSLFKFTDNKTLNTQEEDVVLQENDIFNSGISEVFDAQFGYAGLKSKEQSLITYNSYIFYDEVAKTIYAFGGNQQLSSLNQPIQKVLDWLEPTDVRFVGDEIHNRFFVNLINETGNVCLSFNMIAKAYISIHDINFKFGFHTRMHTYFIHENKFNNVITGWSIYKIVESIITWDRNAQPIPDPLQSIGKKYNYNAYQNCYERSLIRVNDCDHMVPNGLQCAISVVDIIVNTEYEKIKVLNYLSWICSEVLRYGFTENNVAEETLNRFYPGTKLRIYTDCTETDLFNLLNVDGTPKIANNYRNIDQYGNPTPSKESWQYPKYNCGVWSMNYFRDVKNIEDVFSYKDSANKITGGTGHSETTDLTPKITREDLTQENSLLYGKYFVVRFIFDNKNFKLENVILRMNDYGKTK